MPLEISRTSAAIDGKPAGIVRRRDPTWSISHTGHCGFVATWQDVSDNVRGFPHTIRSHVNVLFGDLPSGAMVLAVERGPALEAGLHAGDVIVAINREKIGSEDDLRSVLRKMGPGKHVFRVRRDEQTLTIEVDCRKCTAP